VHHDSTLITVILIAHFAKAKPGIKAFGSNRGGHPQAFQPLGDCTGLDLKHQPLANALLLMARIDKYAAHHTLLKAGGGDDLILENRYQHQASGEHSKYRRDAERSFDARNRLGIVVLRIGVA